MFDEIRKLFAELPESKVRGYKPGRFSFNVHGGRCEACQGQGELRIEMQFLPDVYVPCDVCHGKRFNRETLQVEFKGYSIADVLDMTVDHALGEFSAFPSMMNRLTLLHEVGLGYVRIGQPATTLSGGEAQRVKLAKELSRRATGRTLYVLDEPSVGLHAADVEKLIEVLQRLVDAGNSVMIIEHNLDIIKVADWLIDLGPEGGDRGGELVAEGTPEQVMKIKTSYTGQFLKEHLHHLLVQNQREKASNRLPTHLYNFYFSLITVLSSHRLSAFPRINKLQVESLRYARTTRRIVEENFMENRGSTGNILSSYRKKRQQSNVMFVYGAAGLLVLAGLALLIIWLTGPSKPLNGLFATITPTPTRTSTPTLTSTPTDSPTVTSTATQTATVTPSTPQEYTVQEGELLNIDRQEI